MKLIVNEPGVFLGVKGERLIAYKGGEKLKEVSVANIDLVVLATRGASLSTALLRLLLKHGVDLVVLSSSGAPLGRLSSTLKGDVNLRKVQYAAQQDERGFHLAKMFAKGKLLNQRNLLRSVARKRRRRPEEARTVIQLSREIDRCIARIEELEFATPDTSRKELIRLEAEAAESYWAGYRLLLGPEADFPGRRKRFDQPKDLVNALLNYGYSLLYSYVWLAVDRTSLDPYAGFLHVDSPRRPALVVDLMEEFRQPVVDRPILKLAHQAPSGAHSEGRLTRAGRRLVISALSERLAEKSTFRGRCLPLESHILLQARRVVEFLQGRAPNYTPFTAHW